MSFKRDLIIFGTGKIAELATYYFSSDSAYEVICYADLDSVCDLKSEAFGKKLLPWTDLENHITPADADMFIAIGYNKTNAIRAERFREAKAKGFKLATYISSQAVNMAECIGENCFILEANILQPYVSICDNVFMWSGNHIGHHSVISSHSFVSSHVVISGGCIIEPYCFLGVNSCLRDGITIGEKSVVGAGSIVLKDCPPRSVFASQETKNRVINRDVI